MLKRVCRTRIPKVATLITPLLVLGLALGSAEARVDIANDHSGDPNDGSDIAGGGGASSEPNQSSTRPVTEASELDRVILIPVLAGNVVVFKVIVIPQLKDLVR